MAVDPNVYALSIQLQLDASDAFKTFDDFGKKVNDLEDQLSTAAQKAIKGIQDVSLEANNQLQSIGNVLKDINADSLRIQTNFADASKELKDQYDTGEDRLEDIEEELKHWEKVLNLHEDIGVELTEHLKHNQSFLKLMDRVIAAVKKKNVGHETQNTLLSTDVELLGNVNKNLENSAKKSKQMAKEWAKITAAWSSINNAIKAAVADEEKFVTVNYRAYGAQQSLLQQTRELGMAFNVLQSEALEAYLVLGNLKVPREELDKYALMVARANRTLGTSVQVTGEYVNRLRTAGMSADMLEKRLAHMGEAMRKYGLNTRDVNALMNQSAANAKQAARIFGDAPESLEKWEQARTTMAGFARSAGHGAEELAGFEQWILNDVAALEVLKSQTNTTEKGIDGYRLALMRSGIQNSKTMEEWQAAVNSGSMSAEEFKAQQEALINVYYGGNRAAFEASLAQGKLAREMNLTGASIEEVNKLTEQYTKTLESQAEEANYTFTRQVKELWDNIKTLTGTVLQLIADALLPFVYAINQVIGAIGWVIKKFSGWIRQLEEFSPVTKWIVKALKWIVGIVLALGAAIVVLGGGLIGFMGIIASVMGIFGGLGGLMTRMVGFILNIARAIGQGFVIIMTSIGQGLQALGNAIKGVIVPLLALGLAIMLVGIGAFFFAMAVQRIAETGWAAIPAMLGLIIAIALLGLVLIGLAMLVQGPVALGLVILAAAILAVGLAAMMAGVGIYLAGMGIQMLSTSLSFKLIAMMATLGLAMVALGMSGIMAAPGILIMGVAMMVLAVAAILIAKAFQLVGLSINDITTAGLPELGETIFLFAVQFMAASAMILAGAAMLVPGAALLLAGATALIPAGALLIAAGALLYAGVRVMEKGSSRLETVGNQVMVGGTGMMIGGANLLAGIANIRAATSSLLGQGLKLVIVAKMMMAGAAAMIPAAGMMMMVGIMIFVAGVTLNAGVELLAAAGPNLMATAVLIQAAAPMLLAGAMQLAEGGMAMMMAGITLLIGAVMLTAAAVPLAIGIALLDDSSDDVLAVGLKIGRGGTQMMLGAQGLVNAASLLRNSADHIQGSLDVLATLLPRLSELADALYGPSRQLMTATFMLQLAGYMLVPAADGIYRGLMWLNFAIAKFAKTIDQVEIVSAAVSSLASSFVALQKTPLNGLRELTENALEAIPNLEKLGDGLTRAAAKLDAGVTAMDGPASRLSVIMTKAAAQLDAGVTAFATPVDHLGELATMIDNYASLIESAAERIEVAIATKAVPAMRAAAEAGIEESVRSEAITTVKLLTEDDGDATSVDPQEKLLLKSNELLKSLDDRLAAMTGGNKGELSEILALLQAYLPGVTKGDAGLGSEMNSWAK